MKLRKTNKFQVEYDREGDILYITKGGLTMDDISEEMGDDVVVWKDKKTKSVSGFTVLNFSKRSPKKSTAKITLPIEIELHPLI